MNLQTISQKRKSFAQVLLTEGEPMLMRLKPPIKYDADGKKIEQVRKWYSNFRYKGEKIEVTLNDYESHKQLASKTLWRLQEELESGKVINGFNKPIKKLKPLKPFDKEHQA